MSVDRTGRAERLAIANEIIRVIASHGRRFFSQDADRQERMESPRISRFEFAENGYLYYIDKYRGSRLFAHYEARGRGGLDRWKFSDGGTLLSIAKNLRDLHTPQAADPESLRPVAERTARR